MLESQIIEKDGKLQVSIEYVDWLTNERQKINNTKLEDIEFFQEGSKIEIPDKTLKRFKMVGLSNIDFVLCGFYDEKGEVWDELTK